MERRTFCSTVLGAAIVGRLSAYGETFQPNWDSLQTPTVPEWYEDAKLGIFIHWGLYSVPAWAPPIGELGKVDPARWFTENPYAEWYLNTLRITGSPTWKHHVETYGKDFDYYSFAPMFNRAVMKWDPAAWAKLFQRTGARYVVLTSKHHDGFRLWPSKVQNPRRPGPLSASRDLVGDLTDAVRAAGMKMGLYYSGGLDWTFTDEPIRSVADLRARVPQTEEYARYADAHWRELIERFRPSVMWNDISYPKAGKIPEILAEYYNAVPDGIINDRFGVKFADFTTPEYAQYDRITPKKWESCRGLGFSFGYNQVEGPEHVLAPDKLIALLIDIVSKNGNLLLNVGPKPDGSISEIQADRLQKLGDWLAVNGEGIFGSRPWVEASASRKPELRFTRKGDSLYAFFLDGASGPRVTVPGVTAAAGTRIHLLGAGADCSWKQKGSDVEVDLGQNTLRPYALGLRFTPAARPAAG